MPTIQDIENWARSRGIPVEQAFQELGMKVEKTIQPGVDALKQMSSNISNAMTGPQKLPPPPERFGSPPEPERNAPTLLNQGAYEQNLNEKLKQIGAAEAEKQQNIDSFNPDDYTQYAMGGEVAPHDEHLGKPKFNHLKEMMKKHKKSNSEIEECNNPSIKNRKGVAF